ncbi:MAG: energy-coupling factor ABC transporter permease [Spirochaetaceae bacterium]|jgi:cobalt/nickel transport system permease protein|nr:energy-coupling factor ABC transporter permease [Spirochaetaceae bacterium]
MSDALLSPAVGGVMWAASAAAIGLSVKKINADNGVSAVDEKKIPIMGVMGAFVFAGQMINFTIPGTGSSGHIGGGILLAALLGPAPALITLASVLLIQCLFFADGGLLAYGCNVFNMGVIPCLGAYTLIYRPVVKKGLAKGNITLAAILAVVAGLLAGAFCVVLETLVSGITELPFSTFAALMLPIHAAIGLVEGIVTAAVLCFVHSARPELLSGAVTGAKLDKRVPVKKILAVFGVLTLVVAGGLSLFASAYPDGLEWSMERTAGTAELEREGGVYEMAADAVDKTAFMPDYGFRDADGDEPNEAAGTAVAGITGSVITVLLACVLGFIISATRRKKAA